MSPSTVERHSGWKKSRSFRACRSTPSLVSPWFITRKELIGFSTASARMVWTTGANPPAVRPLAILPKATCFSTRLGEVTRIELGQDSRRRKTREIIVARQDRFVIFRVPFGRKGQGGQEFNSNADN